MESNRIDELLSAAAEVSRREQLPVFLVGGAVRRMLGGKEHGDLDLVVDAPNGAMRLGKALDAALPGCSGPVAISSFHIVELRLGDQVMQISEPLRRITLDISGIGAPLSEAMKQDALLRDFTVNTLLLPVADPDPSRAIDPLGRGLRDLEDKLLRTPLEPGETIGNDPIRMLRAVRFSNLEGLCIDDGLAEVIRLGAPKIAGMPGERIGYEFTKIITGPRPAEAVRALQDFGLLRYFLPELEELEEVDQRSEYHGDDVLAHTLNVLDGVEPDLILRLAALFHDVGKKSARRIKDGAVIFHGHQQIGARAAGEVLRRLRYPSKVIGGVARLVEMHMVAYRTDWSDKAVRRLVRKAGEFLDRLLNLYRADIRARKPPHDSLAEYEHLFRRIRDIDIEEILSVRSPLSGEEVMDLLGIGESPRVGEAMRAVEMAIVDGKIPAEKEAARQFLLAALPNRGRGIS